MTVYSGEDGPKWLTEDKRGERDQAADSWPKNQAGAGNGWVESTVEPSYKDISRTRSKSPGWKILVYPLVINLGDVNLCLFVLGLTSNVCRRSYI